VRLRDQIRALEFLGKHRHMFPKEEPAAITAMQSTVVKIVHEHHPGPSVRSIEAAKGVTQKPAALDSNRPLLPPGSSGHGPH
jgi:hypothetical protein